MSRAAFTAPADRFHVSYTRIALMSRQVSPVCARRVQRPGFYCAGRSMVVALGEAAAGLALLADLGLGGDPWCQLDP